MPTRQVRIRDDHHQFLEDQSISLSAMVQNALDEVVAGERHPPSEPARPTDGHDLIRTSVSVTEEHDELIASRDFVFAVFVHQVVASRLKRVQRLHRIQTKEQ